MKPFRIKEGHNIELSFIVGAWLLLMIVCILLSSCSTGRAGYNTNKTNVLKSKCYDSKWHSTQYQNGITKCYTF